MERTYLTCRECGGEYSENPGDYFTLREREVIRCPVCFSPLERVREVRVYVTLAGVVTLGILERIAQSADGF